MNTPALVSIKENNEKTYSRANERVTGERTGVLGSSHSGSGLISSGAGLPEARYTEQSVYGGDTRSRCMSERSDEVQQQRSSVCALISLISLGPQCVLFLLFLHI